MMLIVVVLFLATRLYNLTLLPITNDEANYIFWAKQIAATNHGWFITLTAGKPPLFLWAVVFFLKLLPGNLYLLAGRLPAVLFGLLALLSIYKLTLLLFSSRKIAMFAAVLYIITPFILFYDRLAFYDSLLTATSLWSVYFLVQYLQTKNPKALLLWATVLGLALLSKPTAILFWAIEPVVFLIIAGFKRKNLIAAGVVLIVSQLIHNILVFSRGYHDYITRAFGYTPSAQELYLNPLALFQKNILDSLSWSMSFITGPIFLLGLVGLIVICQEKRKVALMLITFWLAPILILSFFGRIYFPRYFLFTIPYLLIGVAFLVYEISRRWPPSSVLLLAAILIPSLNFDRQLLTDPPAAPLPVVEDWQYVSGYPSSYGFAPIVSLIDQESKKGPVTLFVQGSFSHFPHAFDLYYWDNRNVKIYERWPLTQIDDQMRQAKKTSSVFIIARYNLRAVDEIDVLKELSLKILVEGKKPQGGDSVFLTTFE